MSIFKKCILLLTLIALLAGTLPFSAQALPAPLSVSAQGAVLIEAESGTVIFSKNADCRFPMASTTKLMTALVALEKSDPEQRILVDRAAVGVEGSSIYLTEGEILTLEQLLYALLLESANDAAVAIAIGVSGSIANFAEDMNKKACALGLTDTHFTNPHGLDDDAHYTTAHELALIAREALENELLRKIVSTRKTTIPHAGTNGVRLLVNHNKLLRLYDGCIGVKTGFTKRSGRCLVSAAERDGIRLIAVTLHAPDDWNDHTAMLDHGFAQLRRVSLCDKQELTYPLPIVGAKEAYVMLGNSEAHAVTIPAHAGPVSQTIEGRRFEYADIQKGTVCAYAVFRCDTDGDGTEEVIARIPLCALYTVERDAVPKHLWQRLLERLFNRRHTE